MKIVKKYIITVFCILLLAASITACANFEFAETGNYIVNAKDVSDLVADGAILVAVCEEDEYNTQHIEGAIISNVIFSCK